MSTVYFLNQRAWRKGTFEARFKKLLTTAGLAEAMAPGELVAVKLHFGESGVTAFVPPLKLKPLLETLRAAGGKPFLTDTATLYAGSRGNAVNHAVLAASHGFDPNLLGAPVIMADGLRSTNEAVVQVAGKHFQEAYVAGDIVAADRLVTVSHFKGHELAGFGGALKNVAMGCATRRGKMQQHGILAPAVFPDKCTGCGSCLEVCAPRALRLEEQDGKRRIAVDTARCVGCGSCFHVCGFGGVEIDWRTDVGAFLERMMEYAAAVLVGRARPSLHVSFVTAVSPECDCMGFSDAPLCPDLGVLASWDPLALDQACLDLVNAAPPLYPSKLPAGLQPGQDKFRAVHPHVPEGYGLDYAASLGLGTREYQLKEI